jgi:chromosomal replication initiation ATPase DnaA
LRWWREQLADRTTRQAAMWFDLPALLKAFQSAHHEGRVAELQQELQRDLPLVLDELHRIAGKPKLQQFVLAVLRAREGHRAPTVLASRWHPKEIRELDPALATSLLAGFVAAIERPGPLGRLRYLRALEGKPSRNGRAHAVEALAQDVPGTFPELRAAWAKSRGQTLPPKYLELIDPGRVFARLRDRVAEKCAVPVQELPGKRQGRAVSRARKLLAWLCLQNGLSGSEVGRFLGGRTRAAVSYMALSLQKDLAASPELRRLLEELT